jgi:hypothetical protein
VWRTSEGIRTLKAGEAALVRAAVNDIWRELEQDQDNSDPWEWGVPLFDNLEWSEKVVLLANVASALLREDVAPMPLTGVNEAAVGVLFEHIRQSIVVEIDCQHDSPEDPMCFWRRSVLVLIDAENLDENEALPKETCDDRNEWEWMVEAIADGILWDNDWLGGNFFMDVDPETATMRKRGMGIDEDYYTTIVPHPADSDVEKARRTLIEFMAQEHDQ